MIVSKKHLGTHMFHFFDLRTFVEKKQFPKLWPVLKGRLVDFPKWNGGKGTSERSNFEKYAISTAFCFFVAGQRRKKIIKW